MPVHCSDIKKLYKSNVAVVQSNDNLHPQSGIKHFPLPSDKSRTRFINNLYAQKNMYVISCIQTGFIRTEHVVGMCTTHAYLTLCVQTVL